MFNDLLKSLRLKKKLTQKKFASLLGVTQPYIVDLEKSRRPPPNGNLLKKMIIVLQLGDTEQIEFYEAVAKARNEIPIDIVEFILNNYSIQKMIRQQMINTTIGE